MAEPSPSAKPIPIRISLHWQEPAALTIRVKQANVRPMARFAAEAWRLDEGGGNGLIFSARKGTV